MILRFILKMLPFMVVAIPVHILARWLFIRSRHIKHINYRHECALLLFVVFAVGLASLTVFPQSTVTVSNGFHTVNLIPFKVIWDTYITVFKEHNLYGLTILLGNIVMFMPFGFFPALLWKGFSLKKHFCSELPAQYLLNSASCFCRETPTSTTCG
jgi:glycopeptide antibiotics resistance protein